MLTRRICVSLILVSLLWPVGLRAQVKNEAVPVIDGSSGCLMGGSSGGAWLKAEEMGTRVTSGDKYRLYNLNGEWKSLTGNKPATQGPPCEDTLFVDIPADVRDAMPDNSHYIGVAGKWNPMPRAPRIESNDKPTYRNAVAAALRSKGIRRPEVKIVKVVRVDLEGDGVEEVIINATRANRWGEGRGTITPNASAGDYSLVMLRKMINGKVQTIMLDEEYHTKPETFSAPDEYELVAVVDLNGDGVMEIVVAGGYYEGEWQTAYTIKGNKAVDVMGCGCGA
ncbi:MAG: FG-GAP repeat protein [Acidobacteria bacterium]|nr:FG-GAP repeat protein [Acidobacteriota bacterium]